MRRSAVLVVLVAGAVVITFLLLRGRARGRADTDLVEGSGTIEATEVLVSPKTGGRVVEVRFREGDLVRAGELVARLDESEIDAQVGQARAALAVALARLEAARNGARPAQINAARANLAQARAAAQGARDALRHAELAYKRTTELRAAHDAARMRLAAAQARLTDAEEALALVRAGARSQQVDQAKAALAQAEVACRKAELDARRAEELYRDGAVSEQQRDAAAAARDAARAQVDQARAALENLLAGARPEELRRAELAVEQARAGLEEARLAERAAAEALADRIAAASALDSARAAVRTADAQVNAAAAHLRLLLEGTRPEDIRAAERQAEQAREALRLAETQLRNTRVYAPCDGVVKTRSAEPGEVVAAGSAILVLLDAARPWLRVYVPENRYGLIRVGDRADVSVDSYPGEVFHGRVVEIASEAEFTPKNVQSREERVKLVFGVKIDLREAGDRLKAGMPADAVIHPSGGRTRRP